MGGTKITLSRRKKLQVPDDPIIPFIEGDGIGPDIWAAAQKVAKEKSIGKKYMPERKQIKKLVSGYQRRLQRLSKNIW